MAVLEEGRVFMGEESLYTTDGELERQVRERRFTIQGYLTYTRTHPLRTLP